MESLPSCSVAIAQFTDIMTENEDEELQVEVSYFLATLYFLGIITLYRK